MSPNIDVLAKGHSLCVVLCVNPTGKVTMNKVYVSEDDILEQASAIHGLERMDQVKYAALEGSRCTHRSQVRILVASSQASGKRGSPGFKVVRSVK